MKLGPIPWNLWYPLVEKRRQEVGYVAPAGMNEWDNIVNWFDSRWIAPQTILTSVYDEKYNRFRFPPVLEKSSFKKPFVIPGYEWLAHELGHFLTTEPEYMYVPWWGEDEMAYSHVQYLERDFSQLRLIELTIGEYLGLYERRLHRFNFNLPDIKSLYFDLRQRQFLYPPPTQ